MINVTSNTILVKNVRCRNNGTCLPLDQRNLGFTCICEDGYTGKYCERLQEFSYISIPGNLSDLSPPIPVIAIMFGDMFLMRLRLIDRLMYINIFLGSILKLSTPNYERFGFLRMFYNVSHNFYYYDCYTKIYI